MAEQFPRKIRVSSDPTIFGGVVLVLFFQFHFFLYASTMGVIYSSCFCAFYEVQLLKPSPSEGKVGPVHLDRAMCVIVSPF